MNLFILNPLTVAWILVIALIIQSVLNFDPKRTTMDFYTVPWANNSGPCLAFGFRPHKVNSSSLTIPTMLRLPESVSISYPHINHIGETGKIIENDARSFFFSTNIETVGINYFPPTIQVVFKLKRSGGICTNVYTFTSSLVDNYKHVFS